MPSAPSISSRYSSSSSSGRTAWSSSSYVSWSKGCGSFHGSGAVLSLGPPRRLLLGEEASLSPELPTELHRKKRPATTTTNTSHRQKVDCLFKTPTGISKSCSLQSHFPTLLSNEKRHLLALGSSDLLVFAHLEMMMMMMMMRCWWYDWGTN